MISSDREIRLLHLLPGNDDDAIRCTVRVVSLDQRPEYEALSYVWGERNEDKGIEISGNHVLITENLHAGLRRLRHQTNERVLWVDQLCINQWDMKEKAAQVALMRDIYKQCTRCVTWMGEFEGKYHRVSTNDAGAVFDFLRQAAAVRTTPPEDLPVLFRHTNKGRAARRAFEAFSMYGNAWWSRVWTVQEAIIPAYGELKWGGLSISRQEVVDAARNLRDLHDVKSLPPDFAARRHEYTELLRRLLYPVHGFGHAKHDGVLNLLMRWRHREATDARDKVYALAGLIPPNAIPSARSCDYTVPVSKLFATVTLDLIRHDGGLRPLLAACEMPQSTPGIPTWAIDFASCNRIGKRQLKWWGHSHRYAEFSASRDGNIGDLEVTGDGTLLLSGVYVDEVVDTCKLLCVEPSEDVSPRQLHDLLSQCIALVRKYRAAHPSQTVYVDGFSWESALVRTLMGDLIMDELPVDRISSYGYDRLRLEIQGLFYELDVALDSKLHLDFAPRITEAEERERSLRRKQSKKTRASEEYIARDVADSRRRSDCSYDGAAHYEWMISSSELFESLVGMMENQTFFVTKAGYVGIGPLQSQVGDQVWIFQGGKVPFVMRKAGEEENSRPQLVLVGDAYVNGIMDGEAMDNEPLVQTVGIH